MCVAAAAMISNALSCKRTAVHLRASCQNWWCCADQGKDGSHATTWALKGAQEILTESFDPIIDVITARDLLAMMVFAQVRSAHDTLLAAHLLVSILQIS